MKKLGVMLVTMALVALFISCGGGGTNMNLASTAVYGEAQFEKGALSTNESPFLENLVKEGYIPELAERTPVPSDRYTPPVSFTTGKYGGTLQLMSSNIESFGEDAQLLLAGGAVTAPNAEFNGVDIKVFKDIIVSDDAKEFRFIIREGLRWSTGEPFTSDDIHFFIEDYTLNEERNNGVVGSQYKNADGSIIEYEKAGEYEYILRYKESRPWLLSKMSATTLYLPDTFMKQYHKDYGDKAFITAEAEKRGLTFDDWTKVYDEVAIDIWAWGGKVREVGYPTLGPYLMTEKTSTSKVYERNPYYMGFDNEGNQLPYIDRINVIPTDMGTATTKIISGQVDFSAYGKLTERKVLEDNAKANNYNVHVWDNAKSAEGMLQFNVNHENTEIAEIIGNPLFKQAVSHAIDRNQINELVYYGKAQPRQMTVFESSRWYKEEYATKYTDFDLDKANALLDELGLTVDGDYRTLPSGESLKLIAIFWDNGETPKREQLDIISSVLKSELKLNFEYESLDLALLKERVTANGYDAIFWHSQDNDIVFPVQMDWHRPNGISSFYGSMRPMGVYLKTDGTDESGMEPSPIAEELWDTWQAVQKEADVAMQDELIHSVLATNMEQMWGIGTVGAAPKLVIANSDLRNLPEIGYWDYYAAYIHNYTPLLYFDR